jgi:competence protein ComEC
LLWLLLPFMGGLAAGRDWTPPVAVLASFVVVSLVIGILGARLNTRLGFTLWAAGLFGAVAAAGVAWIGLHNSWIPEWKHLPAREAVLVLRIERTFPQPEGRDSVSGLAHVVAGEGTAAEIAGRRVYFSAQVTPAVGLRRGATVRVKGILESVARDPVRGGFDEYLVNAGAQFRLGRGRALEEVAPPGSMHRFAAAVSERMKGALSRGLEDKPHLRNIYLAMLLGMKAELGPEQEEIFLRSGTLHLFAISGLHIGAMALALHGVLLLLRVPRKFSAVVQLLLLWIYVQATGAPPSAVRAWIMIAFLRAGQELKWPGNAISAIAASALVVLLIDPFQFFGASFQMSYAVVASLLLLGIPLSDRIGTWFKPFASLPEPAWAHWQHAYAWAARGVLRTVAVCFAATLVSTPMAVEVFGWFTPGAFFANLLVVTMAFFVVAAGFCAACTGMVGIPWLPELFNHAGALVIATMEWLLETVVSVPGIAHEAEFRGEWVGGAVVVALLAILFTGYAGQWRGAVRVWMAAAFLVATMAVTMRLTGS